MNREHCRISILYHTHSTNMKMLTMFIFVEGMGVYNNINYLKIIYFLYFRYYSAVMVGLDHPSFHHVIATWHHVINLMIMLAKVLPYDINTNIIDPSKQQAIKKMMTEILLMVSYCLSKYTTILFHKLSLGMAFGLIWVYMATLFLLTIISLQLVVLTCLVTSFLTTTARWS